MNKTGVKILFILMGMTGVGLSGYFVWLSDKTLKELPLPELTHEERVIIEGTHESPHPEVAKSGGHGEAKKEEHGGGHGEAPKAEGGHGGGHGETAKAEGGHGAPAEGHGGGGHGAVASSGSHSGLPLISFDELFVNVSAPNNATRSLAIKLDLELFDESERTLVDDRKGGVKHAVLTTAREQDFYRLNTIAGKLYFKEALVGRINQYFKKPVVKDVHFSSFFLQ